MDEHTRQRVFEPLDTNSLSLISSASSANLTGLKSNNNSFMGRRCNTPTTPTAGLPHGDENCNEMLQWKLERKDFVFDSNSTPSKKRQSPFYDENPQTAPPPRKRRSQLIGAKPKGQESSELIGAKPKGPGPEPSRLNMSCSKLDLLEDDKITSLPFAPPPQHQRSSLHTSHSRDSGETLHPSKKRSKLNLVESIRVHNSAGQRYISYATPKPLMGDESEAEDEGDNPLIMVEDYIAYSDAHTHQARKRVSVSDLRSKLGQRTDDHIPIKPKKSALPTMEESANDTTSPPIDDLVNDIFRSAQTKNHDGAYGDKYISTLGLGSPVKHCVICDRALYELAQGTLTQDYKEIVCENCTHEYEKASRLFENYEFESSVECSNSSSFMSDLETSMGTVEVVAVPTIRNPASRLGGGSSGDRFSQDLISRLRMQAGGSNSTSTLSRNLTWFLAARDKLKRQWKESGLIPFFMGRQQPTSQSR